MVPTFICHPPSRTYRVSAGRFLTAARMSAQVSSDVEEASGYPVQQTTMRNLIDVSTRGLNHMEERRNALPTTEELRIWRDFIETTEALRAELTSRLQSESFADITDPVTPDALRWPESEPN
jgi:hypothetical protein